MSSTTNNLQNWLRKPEAPTRARLIVEARRDAQARRFLPGGAAARRLAATTVLDVLQLALEGVEAAQVIVPFLPRVLFAKSATLSEQVAAMVAEEWHDTPRRDVQRPDPTALWVSRVRGSIDSNDLRALNRLLVDGVTTGAASQTQIQTVLDTKFPFKKEGELVGGVRSEQTFLDKWRAMCGGADVPIVQSTVVRWARAKRDRAADVGGWSGRLILELHDADPAVTHALAALWSLDPLEWRAQDAATAMWRHLKASFIPQSDKPLPRPVATATVSRRAWGAHAARHVRPDATTYCQARGQYGLSTADGLTAYVIAARAFLKKGATVVFDDRTNSFHELHRRAIFAAVDSFISQLSPERQAAAGRPLVELVARTFAGSPATEDATTKTVSKWTRRGSTSGDPRTTTTATMMSRTMYLLAGMPIPQREHHALAQGSPESSLLEALVYASAPQQPSVMGRLRCSLHDDGWTAVMPSLPINSFQRQPTLDGSRWAEGKDRVLGPLSAAVVAAGHARQAATWTFVAGVPLGDEAAGLEVWRSRYALRLQRVRMLADIEPQLAVAATVALGGPAGMANHILRTIPGHKHFWKEVDEAWEQLWCDIARIDATPSHRLLVRTAMTRMKQSMTSEVADRRYAQGIADAAPIISTMIQKAGLQLDRSWWDALDVNDWDKGGVTGWGVVDLQDVAIRRDAELRIPADIDHTPNMWDMWAGRPPPERVRGGTANPPLRDVDQLVGIRRMLRLPVVGPNTDIVSSRSCVHCCAPAQLHGDVTLSIKGPRAQLDEFGEHALTCIIGRGGTQQRHNTLAYAIRDCATAAGWRATCSAGQIFESHRGRPADVWVENHPRYRAGLAIDCTVVSAAGQDGPDTAARRERKKIDKYKVEVARHPDLGFAPFAIDLYGNLGPIAWTQMQQWATNQSGKRVATRDYTAALDWVVSTIAHAFATGTLRQLRGFYDRQRESSGDSASAPRATERSAGTTRRQSAATLTTASSPMDTTKFCLFED